MKKTAKKIKFGKWRMEYQSMKLSGKQFNLVQFNFCFELVQSSNCPISKFAVTFSDIFIPYS